MTYEYACTSCGHQWEAEQPISARPLTTCPHCHGETAKRQISGGAGFILKGGGWYADGYGSKKESKAAPASPSKSDSTAKVESKSDGKGSNGNSASTSKSDAPKAETAKKASDTTAG